MPRILLVVGTLNAGGLERYVNRVAKHSETTGSFTSIVLCLTKREGIFLGELLENGIEVIEAPVGWWKHWSQMRKLGKAIRELRADIVHSQVNFSLLQQWMVYKLAGIQKIAFTERNCYPLTGWLRCRRMLQFYFIRLMGASYSANSQQVRAHLSKMLFYPQIKIPVIPNGLEIPRSNKEARHAARAKYHWKEEDIVIGYVARMDGHKGHLYFLNVMYYLQREIALPIKICLVGDGKLMPKINDKVDAIGLRQLTTFTGIIPDVEALMPAFDLLCLFSEREGMPNVIIEAMANAVPVMANPVGNVPELLDDGAGWLNTTSDPVETARSLSSLLSDVEILRNTGQKGRTRIEENYGINTIFQILMNYYKSL